MSVKVTGLEQLLGELDRRFGKEAMERISDAALLRGAEIFVKELNASIGTSGKYAKGWSVEDTSIEGPEYIGGVKTVKVHWNGPHGRYRIIHLNEWGTVKIPSPPRKGAIARAMRNAEHAYREAIKQAVLEGI
ncbi:HK97 gp10 family phage protein [Virgibacillus halophilus]|uniref:HK97 gp10 family phage protein n=1 Tax=Tigheibacillus halophilus TaxID=361280 RepID=A0ABU5CBS7_9BACI|nr:HK97 gp10 family phage protein [Virgibacillus halophilus]